MSDPQPLADAIVPNLDAAFNLARWLTRNTVDAEDVVHDACVKALRYGHKVRAHESRAWFLTVVRRAFYDWCGRNRPGWLQQPDSSDDGSVESAPSDFDLLDSLMRKQAASQLTAQIERLSPTLREVLILREFEGLSYQEIAQIVDAPIGTVMSRLSRARSALIRALHAPPDAKLQRSPA